MATSTIILYTSKISHEGICEGQGEIPTRHPRHPVQAAQVIYLHHGCSCFHPALGVAHYDILPVSSMILQWTCAVLLRHRQYPVVLASLMVKKDQEKQSSPSFHVLRSMQLEANLPVTDGACPCGCDATGQHETSRCHVKSAGNVVPMPCFQVLCGEVSNHQRRIGALPWWLRPRGSAWLCLGVSMCLPSRLRCWTETLGANGCMESGKTRGLFCIETPKWQLG